MTSRLKLGSARTITPQGTDLKQFIESLLPFAKQYPYIAATVPSLMWEAKLFDELVELAASDDGLPDPHDGSGVVQMKEIASQRALFALKGALTLRRDEQAARLAVRVGELAAGNSRRINLMRANTDLTGLFLDPTVQERLIATRSLSGDWPGSNLIYEASLLAHLDNSRPLARLRWASAATRAKDWARWLKDAPEDETRGQNHVTAENLAELVWAKTQLEGGRQGARYLAMWRPPRARFLAGLPVCRRLADQARWDDLLDLAKARQGSPWIQLAVASACWEANYLMPPEAARAVLRPLSGRKHRLKLSNRVGPDEELSVLGGLLWAVTCGIRHGILGAAEGSRLVRLHLPDDLGYRRGDQFERDTSLMLFGFTLLALIEGRPFDIESVAGKDCRLDPAKPHVRPRDRDSFEANIVPLAPIMVAFTGLIINGRGCGESQLRDWIKLAIGGEVLRLRTDSFSDARGNADPRQDSLPSESRDTLATNFVDSVVTAEGLYLAIRIDIVRWFARTPALVESALTIAEHAGRKVVGSNEQAEEKINHLVALCRATIPLGLDEARAYFDDAVSISERLGDDARDRWHLLCRIARLTSAESPAASRRARQLARVCEELTTFLYEGPDPALTLQLIGRMSRATCFDVASRVA